MLAELALHLATPASRMTRQLGLVGESVALWSRGLRQRRAWAGHHARCRDIVAQAVAALPERRTAVILGSGLLRDIPLDLLADNFERVLLVDVVHLPQVRLRMRLRSNVALLTRDLTGVIGWLAGESGGRSDPLADLIADPAVDLVVSANLLSQLAWPIEDWLADNPAEAAQLPADLPACCIAWHLDDLRRFHGRVLLLSDVEMIERDRTGKITDRLDLMHSIALPNPDEGWDWPVAPFGEAARDLESIHRVGAWRDFR
ncbi:hypothetical protein [Bosea sp. TAF32]|uniref:hypothetical protein n=1 Tax=Bosea sp. TAF32 TaxID=3237482 RepID=UPI003F921F08